MSATFRFLRSVTCCLLAVGLLQAATAPCAPAAGLLIADGGQGGVLEIKEQNVSVVINNGIAVTEIQQVFLNTENRIVEALYTFPVPSGASVSNFSMVIGGQEMVGEVVEKKRARQIYESYKSVRRDPGLLEQVDYKSFELRVFPIAPKAEQHIKVTYYQQLDFDHDNATYVYPLATTTRKGITEKTTGKFGLTLDVKSEIPITKLFSPSHENDFVIANHTPNYTRASLEVNGGDLSRDVVISFDTERPRTGIDVIASKQAGEDGYFQLTMTAGKELEEYGAGMDYIFVVDISGSMQHDGKLSLSRNVTSAFVDALGKEDRFDVMAFNTVPQMHFQELTAVTEESQKSSAEFLGSQRARGGTSLRPAVLTAYKYKNADRPLNVVILSDGMTEASEQSELLTLIEKAPNGTRVFCVGIGNEVNRPLLKQLAERAGGLAAFVSHQDDFKRQSQMFRRKLMRPVATNVQIAIEGGAVYDVLPGALPDLFYGAPLRMIGRYKQPGRATITLTAEVMGQPITQTTYFDLPSDESSNTEIDRMWAFQKVQQLMDEMRKSGERPAAVEQIVGLCEGYSIVSEYASFIVLENDAEYKRWAIQRRNATRVARDNDARRKLQVQLEGLRDQSLAALGPKDTQLVSTKSNPAQPINSTTNANAVDASPSAGQSPATTVPQFQTDAGNNFPVDSNANRNDVIRENGAQQSSGGASSDGGGGAIDPITGLLAAGAAGIAALSRRRKSRVDASPK